MLEVLGRDYVVNARAQGIGPFRIVAIYSLKNAILPTLAMIGLRFGWMLGGTVLVEGVFDFPGLGLYAAKAAVCVRFRTNHGSDTDTRRSLYGYESPD